MRPPVHMAKDVVIFLVKSRLNVMEYLAYSQNLALVTLAHFQNLKYVSKEGVFPVKTSFWQSLIKSLIIYQNISGGADSMNGFDPLQCASVVVESNLKDYKR